jgi:hypothetical protein
MACIWNETMINLNQSFSCSTQSKKTQMPDKRQQSGICKKTSYSDVNDTAHIQRCQGIMGRIVAMSNIDMGGGI